MVARGYIEIEQGDLIDTYSRSKPDTDSYDYSYCDANPGADHSHCAWLQSAGTTHSGPLVGRRDRE